MTDRKFDFDKFRTEQNNYQDINSILEEDTNLIVVSASKELQALCLILSASVYSTRFVDSLEEAKQIQDKRFKIIVHNNEPFSETSLIKTIEELLQKDTGQVSCKNIIGIDTSKYDKEIDVKVDLDQYKDFDRPIFTNTYKFGCEELVSPWANVLFPFNTETYKDPFTKLQDKNFTHYNLVASGFFWTWLLHKNNFENEVLTLFDISGANLQYTRNLIQEWSPWVQSYSEFVLSNDFAKLHLQKAGQLIMDDNNQIDYSESQNLLDNLWQQEMEKWPNSKAFHSVWHNVKNAEFEDRLSFVNLNLISDHALLKRWVALLEGKTFWFVSNIFTSHISRAWARGSRSEEYLQQQRVLSFLNKDDIIFGTLLNNDLSKSKKARII